MATESTEQRTYLIDGKLVPLGYEQVTTLTSSTPIEPPTGVRVAVIQALVQNVRWRDDGEDPTNSVGMQLSAGRDMLYTGDLAKIRFIEEAASAQLNISYYF